MAPTSADRKRHSLVVVDPSGGDSMRHLPRLNRVAYGILRRQHSMVLTLLKQKPGFRQSHAPRVIYCASRRSLLCAATAIQAIAIASGGCFARLVGRVQRIVQL